ncbi:MAG: hypothetical protein J6N92_07270 [Alloprevotella sp.]|nr:hypothetical protein [Alloprevotella sp.]
MDENVPQLFTIEADGTQYAINERNLGSGIGGLDKNTKMTTDKKDARFTTNVFRKEDEVAFMAQHGAAAIALSGLSLCCLRGGSWGLLGLHNVMVF